MFYKVKEVQPLPDYNLLVNFTSGECKRYNVASLLLATLEKLHNALMDGTLN